MPPDLIPLAVLITQYHVRGFKDYIRYGDKNQILPSYSPMEDVYTQEPSEPTLLKKSVPFTTSSRLPQNVLNGFLLSVQYPQTQWAAVIATFGCIRVAPQQ
eukprot:TRINITY_DN89636_c0_g1_i1.p1 TRINITY_DN89636_c0_g1~~TRINITY_DN89636_c0_g1_i1.p1  ORF type:complete len:101 (+),score=0.57 TRINITY_DN89636_c0_g1_i1:57-359(+)